MNCDAEPLGAGLTDTLGLAGGVVGVAITFAGFSSTTSCAVS